MKYFLLQLLLLFLFLDYLAVEYEQMPDKECFQKDDYPIFKTRILQYDHHNTKTGEYYPGLKIRPNAIINCNYGKDGFQKGDILMMQLQSSKQFKGMKRFCPKPFPVVFLDAFESLDAALKFQKVGNLKLIFNHFLTSVIQKKNVV